MIPEFADSNALPTFSGDDPTQSNTRSPFKSSMIELIDRFGTNSERTRLLSGLVEYRKKLYESGFVNGCQWIDGSFVENVEISRGRPPNDIDLVTLFHRPKEYQNKEVEWREDFRNLLFAKLFDTKVNKRGFGCDTYAIDLDAGVLNVVQTSCYWYGLFSEQRGSYLKKGLVEIPLMANIEEYKLMKQRIESLSHV